MSTSIKFLKTLAKTHCRELEMQKPTQTLKSVKDLGNTFDFDPS
jgi:hypothetical protein